MLSVAGSVGRPHVAEIRNINAILVILCVSFRIGVDQCEGEVYLGPFVSKDKAREWWSAFRPVLEAYWKNSRAKEENQREAVRSLRKELSSDSFRYGFDIAFEIKWSRIVGVPKRNAGIISHLALDPGKIQEAKLVHYLPAYAAKYVALNMFSLLPGGIFLLKPGFLWGSIWINQQEPGKLVMNIFRDNIYYYN